MDRDEVALMVLRELIRFDHTNERRLDPGEDVRWAYIYADEMIKKSEVYNGPR